MILKINPVQLCSRCLMHEVASWVFDNQLKLEQDVIKQIREELKDVKLVPGECIVCNNKMVAENNLNTIMKILEKNKSNQEVTHEFKKLFGICL